MIINRHNYEECFILYMDNELSVENRRLVEEFVAQYPDLKEELDQLMQFKLQPDTSLEFPGKEELWKGSTLIHLGNQTEWLLLYLDGELSASEKVLVEEYLREEPGARDEWGRLQKIKLVPESILFENKEILYRKEEKERKVIPVFFFRIAAAIILAAIGLGLFFIFNNSVREKRTSTPLARTNKVNPVAEPDQIKNKPGAEVPPVIAMNEDLLKEKKKQPGILATFQKEKASGNKLRDEKPVSFEKESIALNKEKEKKPSNDLPLPVNNPRITIDKKALAYSKPDEENRNSNLEKPVTDVTNKSLPSSEIKTAAYNPNEEMPDDENGGKKNRHRGIFRTIVRTFEKRTNADATDNDKLLVAGFRINLK